jgi:hypothetical protein
MRMEEKQKGKERNQTVKRLVEKKRHKDRSRSR